MIDAVKKSARYKRWYDKNRDRLLQEKKEQWHANPELRERSRLSKRKNRETSTKWNAANRDKLLCYQWKARAKKLNALGDFQPWMLRYYRFVQQAQCFYCGALIHPDLPQKHPQKETLDHLTPYKRGGRHDWTNTALACRDCNNEKSIMTKDEFLEVNTCHHQ